PSAEPKNSARRRWLILSGPIDAAERCFLYQARLAGEEAREETPAPANGILDVLANISTRSGFPACSASASAFGLVTSSSVRWCTAYALSHRMRKSGAAAGIETSVRATTSVMTAPSGFE